MHIKKSAGTIFGAVLTASERKAMEIELRKELARYVESNARELDAIILWVLHKELGFGKKRLRQFYDQFIPAVKELVNRYEMEDSDEIWLTTYKLKELGIDLERWEKGEE